VPREAAPIREASAKLAVPSASRPAKDATGTFVRENNTLIRRVARIARRRTIEPPFDVAWLTIESRVVLVQALPGEIVVEVGRRPRWMAGLAVAIELAERHRCVADPAAFPLMVTPQGPAGSGVVERTRRRLTFADVATIAGIIAMAV
jgi:hypothetical protein